MKIVMFIIGILSTLLGFIGVFLPVIPTTPLLLLALYCFSKSSKVFEQWLRNTNMYKRYLEDFMIDRTMSLKRKIVLTSFATVMMIFPVFILDSNVIKLTVLFALSYLYYYFTFKIKTEKNKKYV